MKLVVRLEKDALDGSFPVSSLLREFIFICSKLGMKDMESWARKEMNGYVGAEDSIPVYRYMQGTCKFYNPFHGWCPVIFETKEEERIFSVRPLSSTISEIEDWVHTQENQQMSMEFPAEMKSKFAEMNYGMIPVTLVDRSQLSKILDTVRQKVLDFALQLEDSGILGSEDYMFSNDEKAIAQSMITINQVHGTQIIQQGANNDNHVEQNYATPEYVNQLNELIGKLDIMIRNTKSSGDSVKELSAEINTLKAQICSPKPKKSIIKETLQSVRSILEGAGATLLADKVANCDIMNMINELISSI
uniref:AbiTii domain-containing protein n=1 Tax=uncultured Allisonella sp. TaxID=339338 RepID=UPI00259685A4|nr:hypothetical protein [uncultured Allisonella sp.]